MCMYMCMYMYRINNRMLEHVMYMYVLLHVIHMYMYMCMYMYRINNRMLRTCDVHVMYMYLHIYLINGLSILLSIVVTGGNIGASIGRGLVGSCEICSTTYEYNYNINY